MHGARRVIMFCLLIAVLPTILLIIPLYLRHSLYANVTYAVSESDVLEAVDGMSTVFCQEQILTMNSSFRAFQLEQMPPLSIKKKHIQLQKSMTLPDDTLEYWGFYLLAGSEVKLSTCSRYNGAGLIVVEGAKHLQTCGLMDEPHLERPTRKPNEADRKVGPLDQGLPWTAAKDDLQAFKREVKELIINYPRNSNDSRNQNARKVRHVKKKLRFLKNINVNMSTSQINQKRDSTEKSNHNKKEAKDNLMKLLQGSDANVFENNGGEERDEDSKHPHRFKRSDVYHVGHILDAGVGHGGNANVTEDPDGESSESSFEMSLQNCYADHLINEDINPSPFCHGPHSLNASYKIKPLRVSKDGYYYFIFYSDNDKFSNPIYAHFDLFKATYQNTNYTRGCINKTECRFPVAFWSNEIVIVEVPTRDGIEHGDDDISFLVSSCYPRMAVYMVFPIAVLFLVLVCAFL